MQCKKHPVSAKCFLWVWIHTSLETKCEPRKTCSTSQKRFKSLSEARAFPLIFIEPNCSKTIKLFSKLKLIASQVKWPLVGLWIVPFFVVEFWLTLPSIWLLAQFVCLGYRTSVSFDLFPFNESDCLGMEITRNHLTKHLTKQNQRNSITVSEIEKLNRLNRRPYSSSPWWTLAGVHWGLGKSSNSEKKLLFLLESTKSELLTHFTAHHSPIGSTAFERSPS